MPLDVPLCSLVQIIASWGRVVQFGAAWCRLVQVGADWCRLVQLDAGWCSLMQMLDAESEDYYGLAHVLALINKV